MPCRRVMHTGLVSPRWLLGWNWRMFLPPLKSRRCRSTKIDPAFLQGHSIIGRGTSAIPGTDYRRDVELPSISVVAGNLNHRVLLRHGLVRQQASHGGHPRHLVSFVVFIFTSLLIVCLTRPIRCGSNKTPTWKPAAFMPPNQTKVLFSRPTDWACLLILPSIFPEKAIS